MSLADVTSARSSPEPEACPECDATASVTSDMHKYQVACTCKPSSAQYACADDPGPPPPAKTDTPPALPPRPPTNVMAASNRRNNASVGCESSGCRRRKYAWWCVGCGALAAALGGLLAAQHILLRAYTASPHHLETVPAAVPAAMLVLTGVCIMSLARRRNRYSYMIKMVGACCLVCALTCVLVTITTTVIHMNKLQTLKYCHYTHVSRTCNCYSMDPDSQHSGDEKGIHCAFEDVSDCSVVHGALYWCLRGVFALAVSGVLVCICSGLLAYQLLSHERKKMYWEQLELRCRSLYRPPATRTDTVTRQTTNGCNCCTQCHPTQPAWNISLQHPFWAPGRIGNLYSPNPGTGRKTSAWSWFPWPRTNSQNSRCRMGRVPQSGDSAYGFCETDVPNPNPQNYEERAYPGNFQRPINPGFTTNQPNFVQTSGQFGQSTAQFGQSGAQFGQSVAQFGQSGFSQEGFGEASGSFDAQTGVWGPPPPYSPQGRNGSRHHLHQDPATATLLHHHHIDVHRQSIHDHAHSIQPHTNIQQLPIQSIPMQNFPIQNLQQHACQRNSYLLHNVQNLEMNRLNQEMRLNPEIVRLNPEIARLNPEIARLNPEIAHLQMYPAELGDMSRLQDMGHLGEARFNTLRGHLVQYRNCPRTLGMSAGNLHRDCHMEDSVNVECLHQKSASKVSDQSTDSSTKQGKENLGFQNDKHSPLRNKKSLAQSFFGTVESSSELTNLLTVKRASMQDCRTVNQNAESEVYFADVSSCCNVSVKADCCMNPPVSALVGTIENHPESTSESDTGSFTLTRQQRPQPQVGSKRRPRQNDKIKEKIRPDLNNSVRLTEKQIEQLNNSIRMNERLNESKISERRLNESLSDRMNESRISGRMNESICERLNESRVSENSRICLNDSKLSDRLNETRLSERERFSDRMNESRLSERMNESRLCGLNERRSDSRDRLNDSRVSDRMEDRRLSELNSSVRLESPRSHISPIRMPRSSPKNLPEHFRQSSSDSNKAEFYPPPPPVISPLSPKTEESLLSDDETRQDTVYSNEPESAKCLGPDSQYEPVRDEKPEILKTNHHHCYSDTNTMDSGWQSGSEKQVTD